MDTRTKELIAIGASVTANCVPCLRFHVEKACEVDVEDADIQTAIRVGRLVRKGAASVWDEEAETLLGTEGVAVAGGEEEAAQNRGCP
jgi:AhpD family alkylhydroperoxidase